MIVTVSTPPGLEPMNAGELIALEREWDDGLLLGHVECVLAFVAQEREAILLLADGCVDSRSVLTAVQRHIVHRGTVHPKSEMLDQITEMQRELWYCGERGDHDHARIKLDWTSKHACNWRRWRILQYVFVAERSAAQVVARLMAS
jgi:hypothetical protein